jgi:hypothetical protein
VSAKPTIFDMKPKVDLSTYSQWIMQTSITTDPDLRPDGFKDNAQKYGYDTQKEYIDTEYGEQKLKRGRWYILMSETDNAHSLWHQCEKDRWEMEEAEYSDYSEYADRPIQPKWRCAQCASAPPDSIVAVWCLMEPDMTSELVQEVINNPTLDAIAQENEEEFAMAPNWDDAMTLDSWNALLGEDPEKDWIWRPAI